jgi:hypothetical protein
MIRLKHTEPRHRYLGSLVGDPRDARYKCERKKGKKSLLFLP